MKQELKEKSLYLRAYVKGYFRQGNSQYTGTFTFFDRELYSADVTEAKVVDEFDLEEHCVGHHFQSTRHHSLRFFISENEYTVERVKNFVIRDIAVFEKTVLENDFLIPFEGIILVKLIKPLPPRIPVDEITNSDSFIKSTVPFNLNNSDSKPGCIGSVIKLVSAPFRKPDYSKASIVQGSRIKNFFSLLIGASLITLLLGAFFSFIGISSISSPSFLLVFFLSIFIHGLFKFFPKLQDQIGIEKPILNLFAWVIILFCWNSIIESGFNFSNIHGLLFGIVLWLIARNGKFIRALGWLVFAVQILFYFNQLRDELKVKGDTRKDDTEYIEKDDDFDIEIDSTTAITENQDTLKLKNRIHRHKWKDNENRNYAGTFVIRDDYYNISRLKRDRLTVNEQSSRLYWRNIYKNLTSENDSYLNDVVNEYKKIIKKNRLNRRKAADMVVTSIQNIPYYLVHDLSHQEAERQYGGFIRQYHQTGGGCLELIKFGLQSPTEFMGNFKGDCDTRSVMLYHVLTRLGFNVVVLASDHYGHAILGISGNYQGKYITNNGLNYYVWETTATGFTPGVLSDECGNLRYWYVALESKN
jgi:hypothetical protein